MKFYLNRKSGFTLIELLVVISIISLLSSIVLASLSQARAKARNSALTEEVRQFQNALEIYKSETGFYPFENDINEVVLIESRDSGDPYNEINTGLTALTPSFFPKYIANFVKDINATDKFIYFNPTAILSMGASCGGQMATNGYLLVYESGKFDTKIPLPVFSDGGPVQGIYCVTAPK